MVSDKLKDTVEFRRAEYVENIAIWERIDDAVKGQDAVKAKRETYLPHPNKPDGDKRYESYIRRAVYYNASGITLRSLVGAAYDKKPVSVLPDSMASIMKDVNAAGLTLDQHAKKSLREIIKKGRFGLYVDYPQLTKTVSKKDVEDLDLRARIVGVEASQIINWQTKYTNGILKLALVVISEQVGKLGENGFSVSYENQYRVLKLIDGVHIVEVWRKNETGKYAVSDTYKPTKGDGETWSEIPFIFIGSQDNDSGIDEAPLLDLVNLNLSHYCNSADYEESCFMNGQAQLVVSGVDKKFLVEDKDKKTQVLKLGAKSVVHLDKQGQAYFIQPASNGTIREAMRDKKDDMVSLGARLIKRSEAVKTATEAQSDNETAHNELMGCIFNINKAYTKALLWCAEFMNVSGQIEYTINTDFSGLRLDAPTLAALTNLVNTGMVPSSDVFRIMQEYEVVDSNKTIDEWRDELETDNGGLL